MTVPSAGVALCLLKHSRPVAVLAVNLGNLCLSCFLPWPTKGLDGSVPLESGYVGHFMFIGRCDRLSIEDPSLLQYNMGSLY